MRKLTSISHYPPASLSGSVVHLMSVRCRTVPSVPLRTTFLLVSLTSPSFLRLIFRAAAAISTSAYFFFYFSSIFSIRFRTTIYRDKIVSQRKWKGYLTSRLEIRGGLSGLSQNSWWCSWWSIYFKTDWSSNAVGLYRSPSNIHVISSASSLKLISFNTIF